MRILPLLLCAVVACAADTTVVDKAKAALAGEDPYAKRDAVKALGDKSAVEDADAYPIIVQAVGDRAAHDAAVAAFRARSGLQPAPGKTGTVYPGYPATEDAAGFGAWVAAWTKEQATKKKLDDLTKKPEAKPAGGEAPAEEKPSGAAAPAPKINTDSLGKLDRIVYKSGRSLVAYVRSKRLDADGKLVSVRVVHKDGEGEEVIDASIIARIEEDIE